MPSVPAISLSNLRPRTNTPVSIAPMMDKTDRHFRYFLRLLTKNALLYTEMINPDAIIFGDTERHLGLDKVEHPIALQLGSDDPDSLHKAIKIATNYGYDEYNLNVGCPSDRVQNRNIGACLMADPVRVRECVAAMREASDKPVTVKHRIGIKSKDLSLERFEDLKNFIETLYQSPCDGVTIHARIAILEGLSPKENRTIPPIRYGDVFAAARAFPAIPLEINGHIKSWDEGFDHLAQGVQAIMIGRASYEDPWLLSSCDQFIGAVKKEVPLVYAPVNEGRKESIELARGRFEDPAKLSDDETLVRKKALVLAFARYIDEAQAKWDLNPRSLVWPMLEVFNGMRGSRKFRQTLSEPIKKGTEVLGLTQKALGFINSI